MVAQTAIDYGARRLRLVEFEGSGRKLRVRTVVEVDLDEPVPVVPVDADPAAAKAEQEAESVLGQRIAAAVKEADITTDPSAMALDGGLVIYREFTLPFTSDEQIAKVIRFEAEGHVPMDLDEVVIQHLVLRRTRDKSHLLVAAIKKDDLLDRFDLLERAGLDPMFVDSSDVALLHAIVGAGLAEGRPRLAVLDARDHATTLLVVHEGKLRAVRSMRLGCHGLAGEPGDSVVAARTHDYLGRMQRELRRTLPTLGEDGAVDAVLLCGAGSRVPGVPGVLEETFGRAPETIDFLEHVDHDLDEAEAARCGPDLGVALGIAYKLGGLDLTRTDFRREEAAYTRRFDQIKLPLVALSFMAFLAVCFLALGARNERERLDREYENLLSMAQQQLTIFMEDGEAARAKWEATDFGPDRARAIRLAMNELRDEKAEQLGRSTTIPPVQSALAVWIEFSNLIRDNEEAIGRFALERLDIDVMLKEPTLKLSGQLEDVTHYQTLEDMLRASPLTQEVIGASIKQVPGGVRITDLIVKMRPDAVEALNRRTEET